MPDTVTLAVIADDLTGALDAVVPFAMAGLRCVVATGPAHLDQALHAGAEVIGITTDSRDLPARKAAAVTAQVAEALRGVPVWFKKIDSRLKGNIAAEVEALCTVRGYQAALVCPAIPQMGRLVRAGHLQGMGVAIPLPVAPVIGGVRVMVPDVTDDRDFDAALDRATDALLVGARGLSAALARRMARSPVPPIVLPLPQPIAFAIGSRDPITLAQVARLCQALPDTALVCAPNGQADRLAADPVAILQATPGPQEAPALAVTQALAESFVQGFARGRACLVLSGGETAAAVLTRMRIGLLEVLGEALPGLPLARALPRGDGPLILTKSGGFGAPDTLLRLVQPLSGMRDDLEQT